MRCKEQRGTEFLLHLWRVAMGQQSIGLGVSGEARKVQSIIGATPGTRDAAECVHDDLVARDDVFVYERPERQSARRRIATRYRNEGSTLELVTVTLNQSVDRERQQMWGDVLVAVPLCILVRAAKSKIST